MKFIADLHIHSHFSLATSKQLTPEWLEYWARLKGIQVVGTGDCIHPGWLAEIKEKTYPLGNGFYRLKDEYRITEGLPERFHAEEVSFVLTTEISSIYKKNGKVRKVHSVCVFPDIASVETLQVQLEEIGNIRSDGRPILGLDAKELLAMVLETHPLAFVIPAHIWTPWFSVLGSKSGFDTLEECYEELTPHIFAVETGLSSDPPMNRSCSFLDNVRLVSNSDAHSPDKLGREANLFDTECSYVGMYNALKNDEGFLGTIEFFPEEGKYHYDGHRSCKVCWHPRITMEQDGVCTVCGKPVTKGVVYRVEKLADREPDATHYGKQHFYSITPLPTLIAEALGKKNPRAKSVQKEYFSLLDKIGSEFYTLLFADIDDIREAAGERIADGIARLRSGEVTITEGYDGEFGSVKVFGAGK